jgi:predicted nucleotide-binding protein
MVKGIILNKLFSKMNLAKKISLMNLAFFSSWGNLEVNFKLLSAFYPCIKNKMNTDKCSSEYPFVLGMAN